MIKEISLTNNVSQVPMLAAWVNAVGEELKLSSAAMFRLNLALEEAVVNVMNYAYPGEEGMPVFLRAESTLSEDGEERVVFTLTDEGVPFDPTKEAMPDVTLSAEERQIGGLGIFLVEQLMETVVYRRSEKRNVLTMTYLVNRDEQE